MNNEERFAESEKKFLESEKMTVFCLHEVLARLDGLIEVVNELLKQDNDNLIEIKQKLDMLISDKTDK
jgi:hypothetical protein